MLLYNGKIRVCSCSYPEGHLNVCLWQGLRRLSVPLDGRFLRDSTGDRCWSTIGTSAWRNRWYYEGHLSVPQ